MRILWHGIPPLFGTGYGVQTKIFVNKLIQEGHEVAISSVISPHPTHHNDGLLILGAGVRGTYGNDFIRAHYRYYKPDIIFSMCDTFVFEMYKFNELPWAAWQVIDSKPLLDQLEKPCKVAKLNIAMSRFGQGVLSDAGFTSEYVPLAYDAKSFYPDDKNTAREFFSQQWEMTDLKDKFLIVMNSANMSNPSRKNFCAAFKAFKMFLQIVPDAVMYVHSEITGQMCGGQDLKKIAKLYGLTSNNLVFPDAYIYNTGMYGQDYLRLMYSAADVLLVPSVGEGFCVPVIEAMACNCPVLVSGATSLKELVPAQSMMSGGSWRMTHIGTEQFELNPETICDSLHSAAIWKESHSSYDWTKEALPYEIGNVYQTHFEPLLKRIAMKEFNLTTPHLTKEELESKDDLNNL